MKTSYLWRKLSSAKWEDAWLERLSSVRDRVAITEFPNKKTIRVEAFALTKKQAEDLVQNFGGSASEQKQTPPQTNSVRAPIKVRGKLTVVESEAEQKQLQKDGKPVLLIPAGMAFGTGDHATTSTCLRLLADVSDELTHWDMLDLGCGTAILAIAAHFLGAKRVDAGDFDPAAVRVSRENVRANGIKKLSVTRLDVRDWQPPRQWQVVVANMFSGILIEAAPKIAAATTPGGYLIFSGVLRSQEAEVVKAFESQGFQIQQIVRKGKWVTGRATLPS